MSQSVPAKRLLRPPTKITASKVVVKDAQENVKNLKRKAGESSCPNLVSGTKNKTVKTGSVLVKSNLNKPRTIVNQTKDVEPETSQQPLKKKKRAAWDVKGRLQDLEDYHQKTESRLVSSNDMIDSLTNKLTTSQSTIDELMQFKFKLENDVQEKSMENSTMEKELETLKLELNRLEISQKEKILDLETGYSSQIQDLMREKESLSKLRDSFERDLDASRSQNEDLKACISSQSATSIVLESQIKLLKIQLDQAQEKSAQDMNEILQLKNQCEAAYTESQMLKDKLQAEEVTRRQLHNTIQELKGNIRVFCRVRPVLDGESDEINQDLSHIQYPDDDYNSVVFKQQSESASGSISTKDFPFSFDKVFQPNSCQKDVFEDISQLVQSALDGYNVCIFAYGQTGSGKTFTMEGPDPVELTDENMGMIPRAVNQIYVSAEKLKEKGWSFLIEGQYLEIYNETIRDLIGTQDPSKKYEIKHSQGKTSVTDLTKVTFDSPDQVQKVLKKASENRAVASTNCNERSSRSHSVFTLKITGKNSVTEESLEGILNLIDLAGSERLSSSGSTGDRLKETQAINKSLSSLADVIISLSNKDAHIPYRNSKLTYLLQNSLGGNSKTLMFVNISPIYKNFQESLCSLRFATKVNACQIGTAKRAIK